MDSDARLHVRMDPQRYRRHDCVTMQASTLSIIGLNCMFVHSQLVVRLFRLGAKLFLPPLPRATMGPFEIRAR